MPFNPERYPKDWPAISRRIRERAGQRCACTGQCGELHDDGARCGAPNGEVIFRHTEEPGRWIDRELLEANPESGEDAWGTKPVRVVLTVAHLDHDEGNNADGNLLAVCQRCHFGIDRKDNARRRRARNAAGELPGLEVPRG